MVNDDVKNLDTSFSPSVLNSSSNLVSIIWRGPQVRSGWGQGEGGCIVCLCHGLWQSERKVGDEGALFVMTWGVLTKGEKESGWEFALFVFVMTWGFWQKVKGKWVRICIVFGLCHDMGFWQSERKVGENALFLFLSLSRGFDGKGG